jgi:hypothetical protein
MKKKAPTSNDLAGTVSVWAIPFYAERKYRCKIFIGHGYGIFAPLFKLGLCTAFQSPPSAMRLSRSTVTSVAILVLNDRTMFSLALISLLASSSPISPFSEYWQS